MSTTIYLIRHAEADGNITRRCHGHYNSILTPRGEKQAIKVAERFQNTHFDAIYSSDLNRTRQTATPLAKQKNLEIETCVELREMDLGIWEDKTWGDIVRSHPTEYRFFQNEVWNFAIDNAETIHELAERVANKIYDLAKSNEGKTIAIFSHGIAIRAGLCKIHGLPMDEIEQMGWCENTGIAKLVMNDEGVLDIEFKNDSTHIPIEMSTLANQTWWKKGVDPNKYNMHFIPANPQKDYDKILSYAKEAHRYSYGTTAMFDETETMEHISKVANIAPNACVFGVIDGEIIAFILLDVLDTDDEKCGVAKIFCIDEPKRGEGFSAQIIGHAMSVYQNMGKTFIKAYVSESNAHVLKFFGKYGFDNVCTCMVNKHGRHCLLQKRIIL